MDFLINPNVSYVLLIMGFLIAVLAVFAPGTGLMELGALFSLALAVYGIVNQPINSWAFGILLLGFIPFLLALRWKLRQPRRQRAFLFGLSALAFVVGSAALFGMENNRPAVNPLLIVLLSPIAVGLTWLISFKSLDAVTSRPVFDLDRLVGMTGQASSDIRGQGTVYVNGEEWTASSQTFIPEGSQVRVVHRKGLTLEVERVP